MYNLASQPTLSRLVNSESHRDIYSVGEQFVEAFITSYDTPRKGIVWTSTTSMPRRTRSCSNKDAQSQC